MAGVPQRSLETCKYSYSHEHVAGFILITRTLAFFEIQSGKRECC